METTGKHNGKKVMAIIGISFVVVIRLIIMVVTGGIIFDDISQSTSGKPDDKVDYTVMVYMIGSDLESDAACATEDINEMIESGIGDNVTVVLQTGGTKEWHNNKVTGGETQRFVIRNKEITEKENLGRTSMVDKSSVSDFITWAAGNCPADRYSLIFWNHGGGAAMGFGYDEYFTDDELMLDDVAWALNDAGIHMDFIGFDACLMAGIETAAAVSDYAGYLVASEETEPGGGWFYTDWLNALDDNPDMAAADICKMIADGYINNNEDDNWDVKTMSVIDLSGISDVQEKLAVYMTRSLDSLENNGYYKILEARSNTKSYGEEEYDQIDIKDYVKRLDVEGSDDLLRALDKAVVYNVSNIDEACGLSMYYPYMYLDAYQNTADHLGDVLGYSEYEKFFDVFANIVAYTSQENDSIGGFFGWLFDDNDYEQYDWYDASVGEKYVAQTEQLTQDDLKLDYENGQYLLKLSDSQWDLVSQLKLQVLLDDGSGYIDLGMDNVYDFDDDGNLIVDFDYTWVAFNGMIVPFYAQEEGTKTDGEEYSYGYVPAVLNNETDIKIMVYWDNNNNKNGKAVGYYIDSEDDTSSFPSRSMIDFEKGDVIQFYYDYYDYDGNFVKSYYYSSGDKDAVITYDGEINVSYDYVAEYDAVISYNIEDIYLNKYRTEFVSVQYDE